ncbi:MAG: 4-aminobutyrate--2-oxoglutarate transaminase [Betaproteobacteria bacterium]|nr:4-aminobutyrate--2-oxoglutarate transaminase [Betaproteobacteria bacterium]
MSTLVSRHLSVAQRSIAAVPRGVSTAHPLAIAKGQGEFLWGDDGRRYIDFVGGIGVMNVGHCHPKVVAAVQAQAARLTHTAFQVAAYDVYVTLAERLNALARLEDPAKTLFVTTGAEAVENAVKIARAHTQRPGVVAFAGGFHGRTLMGMSLTGMSQPYKQNFGPFAPDTYHVPYPDEYRGVSSADAMAALRQLFSTDIAPDRVAAVLVEIVQGDGGFIAAPRDFLAQLRELTAQHGIVLIADEIQTGFGRTGSLFAYQQAGITPDLVTVAKSLAGGLPLAAVIGRASVMDAPAPGGLGGTYGGNPIACAAALAVLDLIEEEQLVARAQALGRQLRAGFESLASRHAAIGTVRGQGAMLGLEFVTDRQTKQPDAVTAQKVIDGLRDEGVLVIKCGVHRNIIRCLVPLVARDAVVEEALAAFERVLSRVSA